MLRPELTTYPAEDVFLICKVGLTYICYLPQKVVMASKSF